MTTVAASTLGISASGVLGAAVGGVVGTLASPLAVSVIAGASWLSDS